MSKKIVFLFILSYLMLHSQSIVINEIMYNPVESGIDTTEYVELFNSSNVAVDMTNWSFTGAFECFFSAGSLIDSGAYMLVVNDSAAMKNFYEISDPLFEWSGALLNSSEAIILLDVSGDTIDYVVYDDGGIWPDEPDGNGPSLELLSPEMDNSDADSWSASNTAIAPYGTPGKKNSVFPDTNTPPVISSEPSKTAFVNDFYQYQVIASDDDDDTLTFSLHSSAAFLSIDSLTGNVSGIPDDQDKGIHSVEIVVSDNKNGFDSQQYNLIIIESQTVSNIIINEIMYNPKESGTDTTEYIELFNNGRESVDIGYWSFSRGVVYSFPLPTLLAPDEYLVITVDSNAFKKRYGETSHLHQWNNGALNNSGEDIVLRNAIGMIVDSVTYGSGGMWPSEPDGQGSSLELLDPILENSIARNWKSSLLDTAPEGTPGSLNSVFIRRVDHNLIINELMNKNTKTLEDSTDEKFDPWVELYNGEQSDIHLIGYYLSTDPANPVQYALPDTIVEKESFLLVWCDNDSNAQGCHSNFNLNENEHFIGLYFITNTDTIAIDTISFPSLTADVSYGRNPDGGEGFSFFSFATPGFSNEDGTVLPINRAPSINIEDFILYQNYPNPFNNRTNISIRFPVSTRAIVTVHNILGQEVAQLIDKKTKPGLRTVHWNAGTFPSGIYYYTLKTPGYQKTRKMLLLK